MKSFRTTRPWALVLAILVLLAFLGRPLYADPLLPRPPADSAEQKIAPDVSQAMASSPPAELIPVIITLKQQADLSGLDSLQRAERIQQLVQTLQDTAAASQGPIRAYLESEGRAGNAGPVTPFWIFNGLAVPVAPAAVNQLASRPDVLSVTLDATFSAPAGETSTVIEPNLTQINAPALWDLGFRGQSVVVATMDTGVDGDHPDLVGQWRGGTNSWFDPNGQHPDTPYDASGHGTQSMGVIVGGSAGGSAIGVAPDAQWIAVKIFDDAGSATSSGIHQGFQWLLDPDGDPSTADAPHVVNNSWNYASPGCILDFQFDLQALRAAGIVPVFAAGNAGPYPSTSVSPANNPEAFAVGAVDLSDYVYYESSRGPSACEEGGSIFPEVVAPGVNIYSSDRHGLYSEATGTSLSAPHVSGGLALLLSAYPDLSASAQESALLNSVLDLGPAGPDNDSGYGRLDLLAAYYLLHGGPTPTPTSTPSLTPPPPPTPTPTSTPTSTPTPTFTPTPLPLVNLALNKPVTVSSYQDEGHNGQMAVDGLPDTSWQTKKATGKKTLPSEWIRLDLGSNATISGIVLQWDANYATAYTIAVSADDQNWSTLFATTSADGETDTVSFQEAVARYVMLDTTEWVDGSTRNWLREVEVYGTLADPQPTATPTPQATATATPDWTPTSTATPLPTPTPTSTPADTPTPAATDAPSPTPSSAPADTPTPLPTATVTPADTPTSAATEAPSPTAISTPADTPTSAATEAPSPTATATSTPAGTPTPSPTWTPTATPIAGITVHVGDLDDASFFIKKKWWEATVDVTVHDGSGAPLAGAVVSGSWSDGASGSGSCLTGDSGLCTISLPDIKDDTTGVTFTVVDVSAPGATYEAAANHDPDGDSDGTTIIVTMP